MGGNHHGSIYKFDYNTPLTKDLAEFIGAFIGDGFTNNYGSIYIIQFTGDSRYDLEHLRDRIGGILRNICPNVNLILKKIENQNTIRLTINSKDLHQILVNRFGFPKGCKTYTALIPEEILKKDFTIINSCIRGIFDTDGCVFFDKREVYTKPYLRIALHMANPILILQINDLLTEQGIVTALSQKNHVLHINGFENCKVFVDKVGFSNKRHLGKLKQII